MAAQAVSDAGVVRYRLRFFRDNQRRAAVSGHVEAEVALCCQRCLGTAILPIRQDFELVLVRSLVEAEQLPEEADPLLAPADEPLVVSDLLEDELLLALPLVPKHPEQCVRVPELNEPDEAEASNDERPNPFAVLKTLKDR